METFAPTETPSVAAPSCAPACKGSQVPRLVADMQGVLSHVIWDSEHLLRPGAQEPQDVPPLDFKHSGCSWQLSSEPLPGTGSDTASDQCRSFEASLWMGPGVMGKSGSSLGWEGW